jgi:DNA-binding HxlR family transcriptional regulator
LPTPGLPESVAADLSRVTESLQMLAPRWNVWVLMTVAEQPLRYSDIKTRLPWLVDGQLHPKLRKLTDAGLVERTVLDRRNVLYGLSARGKAVFPVLTEVARWGQTHLEKDTVLDPTTGQRIPKPVPKAQDIGTPSRCSPPGTPPRSCGRSRPGARPVPRRSPPV